jgi:hypothetical protein
MTAHESYWLGYRHGRRIAQAASPVDHEQALRLELQLSTSRVHRAWALGELRGYREARHD